MKRDKIDEAFEKAISDGWRQATIARQTGIPSASINQYNQVGSLGESYKDCLAKWLAERGYLTIKDPIIDPFVVAAGELRALADVLESPSLSKQFKADRFRSLMDAYNSAVTKWIAINENVKKKS